MSLDTRSNLSKFKKASSIPSQSLPSEVPELLFHLGTEMTGPFQDSADCLSDYFQETMPVLERLHDSSPGPRIGGSAENIYNVENLIDWMTKLENALFASFPPTQVQDYLEKNFEYVDTALASFREEHKTRLKNKEYIENDLDLKDFERRIEIARTDFQLWQNKLWELFDAYDTAQKYTQQFILGYYSGSYTPEAINTHGSVDNEIANILMNEAGSIYNIMGQFLEQTQFLMDAVQLSMEFIEQKNQQSAGNIPTAQIPDEKNAGSSDPAP